MLLSKIYIYSNECCAPRHTRQRGTKHNQASASVGYIVTIDHYPTPISKHKAHGFCCGQEKRTLLLDDSKEMDFFSPRHQLEWNAKINNAVSNMVFYLTQSRTQNLDPTSPGKNKIIFVAQGKFNTSFACSANGIRTHEDCKCLFPYHLQRGMRHSSLYKILQNFV